MSFESDKVMSSKVVDEQLLLITLTPSRTHPHQLINADSMQKAVMSTLTHQLIAHQFILKIVHFFYSSLSSSRGHS